jgi:carboxyl-terminal processing protease
MLIDAFSISATTLAGILMRLAEAGSAFTDQTLGWKVNRNGTREAIHSSLPTIEHMKLAILVDRGTAMTRVGSP